MLSLRSYALMDWEQEFSAESYRVGRSRSIVVEIVFVLSAKLDWLALVRAEQTKDSDNLICSVTLLSTRRAGHSDVNLGGS